MPGDEDWTEERIRRERDHFRGLVRERPDRIVRPGPGQESVWDYPRPPRLEREERELRVVLRGVELARSVSAWRVLETSSPPTFYVPVADVRTDLLHRSPGRTLCEWKGLAAYWDARMEGRLFASVAWSYPEPFPGYAELLDHVSFFPGRVDACWLGGERVRSQPGEYYGGWITAEIVGPFKGEPGTERW